MRGDSQVDRRLLRGETIPQEEKVFIRRTYSLDLKEKGKRPVELGVPVCIIEDQFILDHKTLWEGGDIEVDS